MNNQSNKLECISKHAPRLLTKNNACTCINQKLLYLLHHELTFVHKNEQRSNRPIRRRLFCQLEVHGLHTCTRSTANCIFQKRTRKTWMNNSRSASLLRSFAWIKLYLPNLQEWLFFMSTYLTFFLLYRQGVSRTAQAKHLHVTILFYVSS